MKVSKFNENIKLSTDLIDVFKSINSNISKKILELDGAESDIENIKINSSNPELIDFSTINNNGRFTPIRTGRLIRRILDENQIRYVQSDIEQLINDYKSELDDSNIRILKGKDILRGYQKNEYYDIGDFDKYCSLYRSCMTNEIDLLNLYTDNNCCSLVILEKDSKIEARAILWDGVVDGVKRKFLDRIYSIKDSQEQKIKNWAFKNNYLVVKNKTGNDYISHKLIDKNDRYYETATVELDKYTFDKYPYVDTLIYQYENKLTNDNRSIKLNTTSYQLRSTNGERHIYSIDTQNCKFEIVKGQDIRKWYNTDSYEQSYGFNYTMYRKVYESSDLDFLVDNATLLVYLNSSDKLLGRAVILDADIKVCTETNALSEGIGAIINEKVNEIGAATFEYSDEDNFYKDGYYKLGNQKYEGFSLKLDKEYKNYMLADIYLNKTKLILSSKLNPIEGDEIYYIDYSYKYAQFKEVWKNPKGPIIPSYEKEGNIVKSDFDNKFYFKEDTVYAKLSSSLNKSIITHRENCIDLSNGNRTYYVYKYDTAFNITDFLQNEEKTKWLIWCISQKIPSNFKTEYSSYLNDKVVGYDIINYREIKIQLSHHKGSKSSIYNYKNYKENSKLATFDMDLIIKIRPTNIQFRVNDKKGGLIYYVNSRSFKDFIYNKSYELFSDLNNFCNRIN